MKTCGVLNYSYKLFYIRHHMEDKVQIVVCFLLGNSPASEF